MTPSDHDRAIEGYPLGLLHAIAAYLQGAWRDWEKDRLAAIRRRIKKLKEESPE